MRGSREVCHNTPVRRMIACGSLAALVFTTAYAPLFHVHADTGGAPLIHAHFPELEIADDERVVHMEAHHSHSQARPIDILTTTAPSATNFDIIIVAVSLPLPVAPVCCGFVSLDRPRAHAPPALAHLIPRAPPA